MNFQLWRTLVNVHKLYVLFLNILLTVAVSTESMHYGALGLHQTPLAKFDAQDWISHEKVVRVQCKPERPALTIITSRFILRPYNFWLMRCELVLCPRLNLGFRVLSRLA